MCPDGAENRNSLPASGAGDSGRVGLTWNDRTQQTNRTFFQNLCLTLEEESCCSRTLSQGRELSPERESPCHPKHGVRGCLPLCFWTREHGRLQGGPGWAGRKDAVWSFSKRSRWVSIFSSACPGLDRQSKGHPRQFPQVILGMRPNPNTAGQF